MGRTRLDVTTAGASSRQLLQGQTCDDPDMLWGLPGGAAAFIFLFVGVIIGALAAAGVSYALQRRARKASRAAPASGGWRISTALTGHPDSYSEDCQPKGHRTKESLDDATFANILSKTKALLGGSSHVSNGQGRLRKDAGQMPMRQEVIVQQPTFEADESMDVKDPSVAEHNNSAMHDSVQSSSIPNTAREVHGASTASTVHEAVEGAAAENSSRINTVTEEDDRSSIDSEYDLDDLDDEWVQLLQNIDERLIDGGQASMVSRERAIAIRSLLATSATETHDEALERSIRDVLASRV